MSSQETLVFLSKLVFVDVQLIVVYEFHIRKTENCRSSFSCYRLIYKLGQFEHNKKLFMCLLQLNVRWKCCFLIIERITSKIYPLCQYSVQCLINLIYTANPPVCQCCVDWVNFLILRFRIHSSTSWCLKCWMISKGWATSSDENRLENQESCCIGTTGDFSKLKWDTTHTNDLTKQKLEVDLKTTWRRCSSL